MTPLCWEHWIERYESRGLTVLAPAWPGLEGDVASIRSNPAPLALLNARQIIDHYDGIIRSLPEKPFIIGHSFGGAFTQVLLNRGLGAAGVAIDSASVKGVISLPLSTLRAAWPVLRNPVNRNRALSLTPKQFHY